MSGRRLRKTDVCVLIAAIGLGLLFVVFILADWRESARRTQCQDNLKALANACVQHEDTYGSFPAAVRVFSTQDVWISTGKENGLNSAGPNWVELVLGQLQQVEMHEELIKCLDRMQENFNAADDCPKVGAQLGSFVPMGTPSFMLCPAAERSKLPHTSAQTQLENLAKGNYAASLGSGTYADAIKWGVSSDRTSVLGIMIVQPGPSPDEFRKSDPLWDPGLWQAGHGQGTKRRHIRDGVSKTMMLSEVLSLDGVGQVSGASDDVRGVWVTPSMGGSTYSHRTEPNSRTKDRLNGCETNREDIPRGSALTCDEQIATGRDAGNTYAAARSQHRGGVMAATADGRANFYSNDIDSTIWFALGTRDRQD